MLRIPLSVKDENHNSVPPRAVLFYHKGQGNPAFTFTSLPRGRRATQVGSTLALAQVQQITVINKLFLGQVLVPMLFSCSADTSWGATGKPVPTNGVSRVIDTTTHPDSGSQILDLLSSDLDKLSSRWCMQIMIPLLETSSGPTAALDM